MCGITLYIDKTDSQSAVEHIISSLYELQNRGYDSFGISYIESNVLKTHKRSINSDYEDTFQLFKKDIQSRESFICMGHSRWATHGKVNDLNAHPHVSNGGLVHLVHNGIIENYKNLKTFLIGKGYAFYSETDSEVVVNLIEYFHVYETKGELKDAIYKAVHMLEGTYGLVILHKDDPGVAYVIKQGSPLLISETDQELLATSELCGFRNHTDHYYELTNNELVILSRNQGIIFENKEDRVSSIINHEIQSKYLTESLGIYTHYTQKEIMSQDETLMMTLNQGARIKKDAVCLGGLYDLRLHLKKIQNIIFMGCGSSYYAGCIGYHYIKNIDQLKSRNVFCFDGGDFEIRDIPHGICLFVFISQSGETMDLMKHLKYIQNHHYTMGIVNVIDSSIAKEVDCGIYMNVGKEVAVASTKSFNSSILLMKLFALWLYQETTTMKPSHGELLMGYDFLRMANYVKEETSCINQMIYQVKKLNHEMNIIFERCNMDKLLFEHIFVLGKGSMECVARECALKLKEICYIHGEGLSGAALKHGPLAMIHSHFPVILLINHENSTKMMNAYHELMSRDAYVFVLTSEPELCPIMEQISNQGNGEGISSHCDITLIPRNKGCSEILFMLALQQLCYHLALRKRINPDKPKNLAKVVTVE